MKLLSKIFSLLGLTVSVIVLIVAAAFIAPKFVGIMPYIVKSGSMEPQIHTGAVAFIDTRDKNVAVGDVITYKIGEAGSEKYVTHRIVGEKPDGYVTKGDANEVEDANCVKQGRSLGHTVIRSRMQVVCLREIKSHTCGNLLGYFTERNVDDRERHGWQSRGRRAGRKGIAVQRNTSG